MIFTYLLRAESMRRVQVVHAADQQRALDRACCRAARSSPDARPTNGRRDRRGSGSPPKLSALRTVQSTASRHCSIIAGSGTTPTLSNSGTTSAAPAAGHRRRRIVVVEPRAAQPRAAVQVDDHRRLRGSLRREDVEQLHLALAVALGARRHRLPHRLAVLADLGLYGVALRRPDELVVGLVELGLRVVEEYPVVVVRHRRTQHDYRLPCKPVVGRPARAASSAASVPNGHMGTGRRFGHWHVQ